MAEYKDEIYENSCPVRIMVMGVGGGGNNAVDRMVAEDVKNAEFVAINTDKQALSSSRASKKIVIGEKLTKGFGAGADPIKGAQAAEESKESVMALLKGVDLLFLTAGMGGGTGTGAMPVIASIAKEMGILTVAVVTKPFGFEGNRRMNNAIQGIDKLKKYVDTLLVIPNDKLMDILPKGTPFIDAFKVADDVLKNAISGITEVISSRLQINLDFADINAIMRDKGIAHMGVGEADGDGKTVKAVRDAVASPLLETRIEGATGVILCFIADNTIPLNEVDEATNLVKSIIDPEANIIFGVGFDTKKEFTGKVRVVLIATGFEDAERTAAKDGLDLAKLNNRPIENESIDKRIARDINSSMTSNDNSILRRPANDYQNNNDNRRHDFIDSMRTGGAKTGGYDEGLDIVFPQDNDYRNERDNVKTEKSGRINVDESNLPPFIRQLRSMGNNGKKNN